ncbi:MAG: alpha/beta hydrolase [Bacteroidales bacterium]|nr:alpha/beta hydrolase [Bacteroidales bacterium]
MKTKQCKLGLVLLTILIPIMGFCQVEFVHQQDVVYGYKDGMALVMDIYSPSKMANKGGIIVVMAGGMTSSPSWSHEAGRRPDIQNLLNAGYVVFATAHSSQPKYTVDESSTDIPRAVRFIRYNAERFGINPDRIGLMGYSSGGHVTLMSATSPPPGNQESDDPVDHESSKVLAAVAYYPSSDLLNFGQANTTILEHFNAVGFNLDAAFDFHRWDNETLRFERIENLETIREYYIKNSAINFVSDDDPPILIIHGSDDKLVPVQQSKLIIDKLQEHGVKCKLLEVQGKGHGNIYGWDEPSENEYNEVIAWFNQFLH